MNENKLIAEFMGIDQVDIDYAIDEHGELKYHKDWNWLMPVVAKCHEENSRAIRLEIGHRSMYGANISIVYEAVVEFIKEYNRYE